MPVKLPCIKASRYRSTSVLTALKFVEIVSTGSFVSPKPTLFISTSPISSYLPATKHFNAANDLFLVLLPSTPYAVIVMSPIKGILIYQSSNRRRACNCLRIIWNLRKLVKNHRDYAFYTEVHVPGKCIIRLKNLSFQTTPLKRLVNIAVRGALTETAVILTTT